jgi:hypothetical protein
MKWKKGLRLYFDISLLPPPTSLHRTHPPHRQNKFIPCMALDVMLEWGGGGGDSKRYQNSKSF